MASDELNLMKKKKKRETDKSVKIIRKGQIRIQNDNRIIIINIMMLLKHAITFFLKFALCVLFSVTRFYSVRILIYHSTKLQIKNLHPTYY